MSPETSRSSWIVTGAVKEDGTRTVWGVFLRRSEEKGMFPGRRRVSGQEISSACTKVLS